VNKKNIGIIGIALRFPGKASRADEFWKLLKNSEDGIIDVPDDRWSLERYYDSDLDTPGKMCAARGGFLKENIFEFDNAFFGISPKEASSMDPQQRLLLELTWEAIEDSGIKPDSLKARNVGVFVGGFTLDSKILQFKESNRNLINPHTAQGMTMGILAARIAYTFDFRGPCLSIDTACSSSLVALHQAAVSIRNGECDIAVVGGVNLMFIPGYSIAMSKGQFLSPDCRCKTFDKDANGYVRAEGAGIVILKSLPNRAKPAHPVYALLYGTGINQNGRSSGITLPNPDAQAELIEKVCKESGVKPSQIGYLEAHGTGTQAGDKAEAKALGQTYGKGRKKKLPVGSVKTNIGHLEAAAGIAGLIKTALILKNREIPPNLHFNTPNPEISFNDLGIRIPGKTEKWPDNNSQAYAAVNSFGYGGTNAHAILGEYKEKNNTALAKNKIKNSGRYLLLPISARSETALKSSSENYLKLISEKKEDELQDLCYSAACHRTHFEHRLLVLGKTKSEIIGKLKTFIEGKSADGIISEHVQGEIKRKIFVYSGMGPQYRGMGKSLFENFPVCRSVIRKCDKLFRNISGKSLLKEMMACEEESGIMDAELAQAANFTLQTALSKQYFSWGIKPDSVIGYSVGEITAAYISGALSLDDALKINYHSSRLQQKLAGKGKMLAAALSQKELKRYIKGKGEKVSVAAVNGRQNIVLTGDPDLLEEIAATLEKLNIFNRFLNVNIAYHSSQMDSLKDKLLESLKDISPEVPRLPLYSTVKGGMIKKDKLDNSHWWKNLRNTVLFSEAMDKIIDNHKNCIFIEIGPHPVLSPLIRESLLYQREPGHVFFSQHRKKDQELSILETCANLHVLGLSMDFDAFYPKDSRYLSLPNYPWQRQYFLLESKESQKDRLGPEGHPFLGYKYNLPGKKWYNYLNTVQFPFLEDHRIQGHLIFPGSGYIEAGLAVGRELIGSKPVVIESLEFLHPLIIEKCNEAKIHVEFNEIERVYSVYSALQDDQELWTLNAKGRILQSPPESAEICSLPELHDRCNEEIDLKTFYEKANDAGLNYGSNFRAIKNLSIGCREAFSDIELPYPALNELSEYRLHPVILDSCFQTIIALAAAINERKGINCVYLPSKIACLTFYSSPKEKLFCHVKINKLTSKHIECDLKLLDADGKVYADIQNLYCKELPDLSGSKKKSLDNLFYQYEWIKDKQQLPYKAIKGKWLFFAENENIKKEIENISPLIQAELLIVLWGDEFKKVNENYFYIRPDSTKDLDQLFDSTDNLQGIVWMMDNNKNDKWNNNEFIQRGTANCINITLLLQRLISRKLELSLRLYLITNGAEKVLDKDKYINPAQSSVWGLGRVVANEHPYLNCTLIDLDSDEYEKSIHSLVLECLGNVHENELALRQGVWYSHRLVRVKNEKNTLCRALMHEEQVLTLDLIDVSSKKKPVYRQVPRREPDDNEVEIKVITLALSSPYAVPDGIEENLEKLPCLLFECSGIIVNKGKSVKEYNINDEIIFFYEGSKISSFIYLSTNETILVKKPACLNFDNAAALSDYMIAYTGLHNIARIQSNDTVYINADTGVFPKAAVQYALSVGAKVIAGANNKKTRLLLKSMGAHLVIDSNPISFPKKVMEYTNGAGVDTVFNLFAGEILEKSLSVLAPQGHYIQLLSGASVSERALKINQLNKNISFSTLDIQQIYKTDKEYFYNLLIDTFALIENGVFSISGITVLPAENSLQIFNFSDNQNMFASKIISFRNQEVRTFVSNAKQFLIKKDATYLIAGGLSGLGFETAKWLVEQGARYLVLIARSGISNNAVRNTINSMSESGVVLKTVRADISKSEELTDLFCNIQACLPPLKGIFHSAGILNDGLIGELNKEQFEEVMAPKSFGAWNLHMQSLGLDLDFFLLYSSLSSLIGNYAQGNYAAANAYLDGLAHYRQTLNLPVLNINWGVLSNIGMTARNKDISKRLKHLGLNGINSEQVFESIEHLFRKGYSSIGVFDLDWEKWTGFNSNNMNTEKYSHLMSGKQEKIQDSKLNELRQIFSDLDCMEQKKLVESTLKNIISDISKYPLKDLDSHSSLDSLGIDSLMILEMIISIEKKFGVQYKVMDIMKGVTIKNIVDMMIESIGIKDLKEISG